MVAATMSGAQKNKNFFSTDRPINTADPAEIHCRLATPHFHIRKICAITLDIMFRRKKIFVIPLFRSQQLSIIFL
jgi:hypothetical protein